MIENTSVAVKLRRCPFCNGVALTRVTIKQETPHKKYLNFTIKCLKCDCSRTTTIDLCDTSFDDILRGISKAIDEWNRRVDNGRNDTAEST